jgi:hypothetical protein
MNIQFLIRENVGQFYIELTSEDSMQEVIRKLDKLSFFTNLKGWISRNKWTTHAGPMKYLVVNLNSKEVAFNRMEPNDELRRTKLFVNEFEHFNMEGPKKKLLF